MNANAAKHFIDRHTNENNGSRVAFKEADGQKRFLTYDQLAKRSDNVASSLKNVAFGHQERAAMLVLDQIEFPQIFWGCLKAGVAPVPLNTMLPTSIYQSILSDCGASVLFVSSQLLAVVSPILEHMSHLKTIIVIGEEETKTHQSYDAFLALSKSDTVCNKGTKCFEACKDDIAFWLYSSGSTGEPKGVRHTHGALLATAQTYGKHVLKISQQDTVFSVAKMFFAYGLGNAMTFPLSVGATTVLYSDRPTPQSVTQILENEKPTIFCGVPTLYAALLAHIEALDNVPTTYFQTCISAGEALPEMVGKSWQKIFGVDILDGVGSTEMLHIFLSNSAGSVVYGTSGKAVPGYELRLLDDQNKDVKIGGLGELLVRGKSSAVDYWNQPRKSSDTFQDGWTRTGDKYQPRQDGRYVYCGRSDDMFKVSGIWVSPFEIEQALISHPSVLEAAVVAGRDDEGLEKPKAFVVLKPSQNHEDITANLPRELKEFVKTSIGRWKYPRWVEIVKDLPKTATGKIQRFKLR